jgi:hypothetical protein
MYIDFCDVRIQIVFNFWIFENLKSEKNLVHVYKEKLGNVYKEKLGNVYKEKLGTCI